MGSFYSCFIWCVTTIVIVASLTRNNTISSVAHPLSTLSHAQPLSTHHQPYDDTSILIQSLYDFHNAPATLPLKIIQIGAHIRRGNDPLVAFIRTMQTSHHLIIPALFIEPSPVSFAQLTKGLGPGQVAFQGAVGETQGTLAFYTFSADIDPDTGKDTRSGKQLEFWITQVASLDYAHLERHAFVFENEGLVMEDYVETIDVRVETPLTLLERFPTFRDATILVIDVEGRDHEVLKAFDGLLGGIQILVIESKWLMDKRSETLAFLTDQGFTSVVEDAENFIASRTTV